MKKNAIINFRHSNSREFLLSLTADTFDQGCVVEEFLIEVVVWLLPPLIREETGAFKDFTGDCFSHLRKRYTHSGWPTLPL